MTAPVTTTVKSNSVSCFSHGRSFQYGCFKCSRFQAVRRVCLTPAVTTWFEDLHRVSYMKQHHIHGESVVVVRVQVDPKLLTELVPVPISHPCRAQPGDHRQERQKLVHLEAIWKDTMQLVAINRSCHGHEKIGEHAVESVSPFGTWSLTQVAIFEHPSSPLASKNRPALASALETTVTFFSTYATRKQSRYQEHLCAGSLAPQSP